MSSSVSTIESQRAAGKKAGEAAYSSSKDRDAYYTAYADAAGFGSDLAHWERHVLAEVDFHLYWYGGRPQALAEWLYLSYLDNDNDYATYAERRESVAERIKVMPDAFRKELTEWCAKAREGVAADLYTAMLEISKMQEPLGAAFAARMLTELAADVRA
jgi:hypothetical protein